MKQLLLTFIACFAALTAAADISVNQCVDAVLDNNLTLNASSLQDADRNADGLFNICDVTLLIDEQVAATATDAPARAQAASSGDAALDGIVEQVLDGTQQLPAINQHINQGR